MTCEHLERLIEEHGPVSCGELAKITGMSEAYLRTVASMCFFERQTITVIVERDAAGKKIERMELGDPTPLLLMA